MGQFGVVSFCQTFDDVDFGVQEAKHLRHALAGNADASQHVWLIIFRENQYEVIYGVDFEFHGFADRHKTVHDMIQQRVHDPVGRDEHVNPVDDPEDAADVLHRPLVDRQNKIRKHNNK